MPEEHPSPAQAQRETAFNRDVPTDPGMTVENPSTNPTLTIPAQAPAGVGVSPPPGYEILGELGRGGMGVVYKARQLKLGRIVALKMILAGGQAGDTERQRFATEAQAIARLNHAGIVQVFEVGEHTDPSSGVPQAFMALEFCPGGSLDQCLRDRPPTPADAARMVLGLAQAIHAAHAVNVLHRDLKPANVLIAADDTLKITDFGLAKKLDESGQTHSGSIMGTPSYMPPEQATGRKDLGPTADVYALGAILYECLTGRPPHRGATALETLLSVMQNEVVAVRRLNPAVSADLETICHKCLNKVSPRRYATAQDLADDLGRFLAGQPIQARPVGWLERGYRWVRRNPVVAALLALVVGTLVAGTVISATFAYRAEQQRAAAEEAGRLEADARTRETTARQESQRRAIDLAGSSGLAAARSKQHAEALLWFAHAVRLAEEDPERRELNRIRVRNWSNHVPQPVQFWQCPGFRYMKDRYRVFEFHPTSDRYLLVQATGGRCTLWDVEQGIQVPLPDSPRLLSSSAWSRDGNWLALGTPEGAVEIRAFPSLELSRTVKVIESGPVLVLAFGPQDRHLAIGTQEGARVWDCERNDFATPLLPHPGGVATVSFNTRGHRIVTSCADHRARVYAVPTEKSEPLFPPVPHSLGDTGDHGGPDTVRPLFVNQDTTLVTITDKHQVIWRDAATGQSLKVNGAPAGQILLSVWNVSPNGQKLAVLWRDPGRIFSTSTRGITSSIPRELPCVEDAVYSPDGSVLATGSHDTTVRFHSTSEADLYLFAQRAPIRHPSQVVRVRYSPSGALLASGLWDGTVHIWRMPTPPTGAYRLPVAGPTRVILSPDGSLALAASVSHRGSALLHTQVVHASSGKPAGPALVPGGVLLDAAFSPGGDRVALAASAAQAASERGQPAPDGKAGSVQVWDWRTGKRLMGPVDLLTEPRGLAWRPDGRQLAFSCADGWLVIVGEDGNIRKRIDTGTRSAAFPNLWWSNGSACYSPDGKRIATWEMTGMVQVWDAESGRRVQQFPHSDRVESAYFSPDGAVLLTACRDSHVRVWDLATGQLAAAPLRHPREVFTARFDADPDRVITCCDDGTLRVWEWRRGRLLAGHQLHRGLLTDFALTTDRRWLVTTAARETLVSDWRTGAPVAPILDAAPVNLRVVVPKDQSRAIVSGFSGALVGHDLRDLLTPSDESVEILTLRAELASGLRVHESGQLVQLTSSEWAERWQRWQRNQPRVPPPVAEVPQP